MFVEGPRTIDTFTAEPAPWTVTAEPPHCLYGLWREQAAFRRLLDDLRFIRGHYDIRVRVGRKTPSDLAEVSFERYHPAPSIASDYTASFRKILGQYPPEFIRFCGITQARIVEILFGNHKYWKGNMAVGGLASSKGPIYVAGYDSKDVVHHEIFHRADQTSWELGNRRRELRRWKRLNRYRKPYLYGSYWRLTPEQRLELPYQGFAEPYGRVNIWEDRATVAELLMASSRVSIKAAKVRMAEDEILAEKASIVIRDLYQWSGGRMNEQYFDALKRREVNEEYWATLS